MIALAVLAAAAVAQSEPDPSLYDRLYTGCAPVSVSVSLNDETQSLGVADKKELETLSESRLRAARLFAPQSGRGLFVAVDAVDGDGANAYYLRISFFQLMVNPVTEGTVRVPAWDRGFVGWFGDLADPSERLQGRASYFLDEFIRDYLRVNEDACE